MYILPVSNPALIHQISFFALKNIIGLSSIPSYINMWIVMVMNFLD
jgi:hypothetical protein